jgi:hypothetical protein
LAKATSGLRVKQLNQNGVMIKQLQLSDEKEQDNLFQEKKTRISKITALHNEIIGTGKTGGFIYSIYMIIRLFMLLCIYTLAICCIKQVKPFTKFLK